MGRERKDIHLKRIEINW